MTRSSASASPAPLTSLNATLKRAGLKVREDDVYKDVAASVSRYFRTDVRGDYVWSVVNSMSAATRQ